MMRIEQPWEQLLGKNTMERTKNLGLENENYRKTVSLPPIDGDVQKRHNVYIHQIGADVLQTQIDEKKEAELAKEALKKKLTKVGKLLRKKIKVADIEDGGVSISIDQEWDTSTWSDELIEAGCEALILIFHEADGASSTERKERAVHMLQKLLGRHPVAENYVRKNIEMMIGKAASKLIKGGRCGGLLDLLYILHSCRETFVLEMSQFNFNGKALEMLVQEAKLAAIIIQHSFRSKKYSRMLRLSPIITHEGFGTEKEARFARMGVVNARSNELRAKWRSMRCFHHQKELVMAGGLRGPIHIGPRYTELTLDIMLHLLSRNAGIFAQSNREDVVRSNGCILLATYLSFPTGRFSFVSAAILANIARVAESFEPVLHSGCLYAVVKVLKYLRLVGVGTQNIKEKRHVKFPMSQVYFDCVDIVTSCAVHAAGLFRAGHGYGFQIEAQEEVEKVNYLQVLQRLPRKTALAGEVSQYLGGYALLKELCTMVLQTNHSGVVIKLLQCLFSLLCGHAHLNVVKEVTALSGVLIIRLTELLHAKDRQIGTLALCIYLQLSTLSATRKALNTVQVARYLVPLNAMTTDFSKRYHQRSILATVAMCRQGDRRAYDPLALPILLQSGDDVVRWAVYLDLLVTLKAPTADIADSLQIADLVVMPTCQRRSLAMSVACASLSAKQVADFLCHPEEESYYEALPLHEAVATCSILEGMATHPETALLMFSPGLVRFLAKYLYLCKYLFLGRPMEDAQIMVLLNGTQAAALAMSKLCSACGGDAAHEKALSLVHTIRKCDLVSSVLFFLNTLSVHHPKLEERTLELQKQVGLSCLAFFNAYAQLLILLDRRTNSKSNLQDLSAPGVTVINLITLLRVVHGQSPYLVVMFDDMCQLLHKITITPEASFVAIQEWKVLEALRAYLPPPLSGIVEEEDAAALQMDWAELGLIGSSNNSVCSTNSGSTVRRREEIKAYRMGLDQLPSSFFELCANLSQSGDGVAHSLTDGFLRRALDKLVLLHAKLLLIGSGSVEKSIAKWAVVKLEFVGCMRLVIRCANFHRAQVGSSNDLILHRFYPIVEICKALISRKELARSEEIVLVAYETLAALARDTYRVNPLMEAQDIFSLIRHDFLFNIEQLPPRGAVAALEVLHFACFGLTSDYIVKMIPLLREPLSKVARVHPEVNAKVREANWTLTKSAMIYRSSVESAGYRDEQQESVQEMEDFIRTGQSNFTQKLLDSKPREHLRMSMCATAEDLAQAFTANSSITSAIAAAQQAVSDTENPCCSNPAHKHSAADLGTYLYCGVSSCGSLRLSPEDGDWGHGKLFDSSETDRENMLLRSASPDPAICRVSRLSADSPGLQRRLEERKGLYGFQERKKVDIYRTSADALSPSKAASRASTTQKTQIFPSPHRHKSASAAKGDQRAEGKKSRGSHSASTPRMMTVSVLELPELQLTRPK